MIHAKKSRVFTWMFDFVFRYLLKKSFHQVLLRHSGVPVGATVYIANHSNWWDGLLLFKLQQVLKKDMYVMMHEHNLKRIFFFRWLGAFSVNQKHPKSVLASLRYAGTLLQNQKGVCLFPQGDEYPLEKRPLQFDSGALYIIEQAKQTPIVPVVLYYGWTGQWKPTVWLDVGEPMYWDDLHGINRTEKNKSLEAIFTKQLDALRDIVIKRQWDDFKRV